MKAPVIVGWLITLSTVVISCTTSKPAQTSRWRLVWQDDFEYKGLPDSNKWTYDIGGEGWGNNELQFYTGSRVENARVESGTLVIEARKEDFRGNAYTSARLVTRGKQDFRYGKIEMKAKLPKGRGTWPAFWMLSSKQPRVWPDDGEIDIMEHVGYEQGEITGAAHVKRNPTGNDITTHSASTMVSSASDSFHIYSLIWTAERLEWYVDDKLFHSYDKGTRPAHHWPFDSGFYLILNIAMGGTWGGKKGVDDTIFPQRFEVDYVRVYKAR